MRADILLFLIWVIYTLATLYPSAEEGAKYILGYRIETMDQFFIVFVFLAGLASVLLFALCPLIKKMMKGVA